MPNNLNKTNYYFTGLELVAAELGGRRKVKKLLEPFNCKCKAQRTIIQTDVKKNTCTILVKQLLKIVTAM